ncbi:MAG: SDR family oxidoreductase [Roseicyclus sp.]|nr:SDR family oxidoreductase [Roseicyclus sp.]MBO6625287.1 SDR family oxidoreductase [Roseicyclus sp.]MBO6922502.1 SDR family oxidoreductase [Roseicyclus sp.]
MTAVLITGAASGIGLAVACRILNDGGHAVLLDTRPVDPDMLPPGSETRAILVEGSVTDPAACEHAVRAGIAAFGGLSGVSHNAGIQRYGTAADTDPELWNEVLSVNLTGAFNIARAALPQVLDARGAIVFMGSVQSLASQRNVAAYTASKHGLLGLVRSMAMDFAERGVRVNMVAPGAVQTPMLDWAVSLADAPDQVRDVLNGMHPLGRVARAEEVAAVVSFLLSDDASFITGETVRVDGGLLTQIAGTPKDPK